MRKLLVLILCTGLIGMSSLAFAKDVVVTKRGKKYHMADCRLIKNSQTTVIDEEEAISKGLKPCGLCIKDGVNELEVKNKKVDEKLSRKAVKK